MGINASSFIRSTLLLLTGFLMVVSTSNAQTSASGEQVATVVNPSAGNSATANAPVFTDYRGIRIGMTAEEVRSTLDGLKKDNAQDFFVFSEKESAQIFYDQQGKVMAISIDYFGENSNAPAPDAVLGMQLEAKPDGSMYQLKRYPEAGYWVSYNRTAGDKPIITITMQKM